MRRKPALMGAITLFFGLLILAQVLVRPRMAEIHNVDIFSLVVAGACLGAGLVAVVLGFRVRREL